MSMDLFQSRNTYNERCKWWSRNENDEYESDELVMKKVPSGTFMAKEVSPESDQDNVLGGVFLVERTMTSIKTPDNVFGIKKNDLVMFQNEKWIVLNVQKSKAKIQNTMFANDKHCSHFYYIELRK